MNHQTFKERLEEIANKDFKCGHCGWDMQLSDASFQEATQSLITLFEEYTKAIVGEEEEIDYDFGDEEAYIRNQLRQTINQTSKNILRNEE